MVLSLYLVLEMSLHWNSFSHPGGEFCVKPCYACVFILEEHAIGTCSSLLCGVERN